MKKKKALLVLAIATGLLAGASGLLAEEVATQALVRVNPETRIGEVNPLIFGNNIEAANSKGIFGKKDSGNPLNGDGVWDPDLSRPVPEVVAAAKELRLGMLRYPGGCLTHNFDWHQAVGAPKDRDYFKFGIDEYIQVCRAMGAEPLMNVSEICSPKDAADLVEYLNLPAVPEHPWAMKRAEWGHKEPYQVKYFEMANESDHGNHNVIPHLKRTAEQYAEWYLSCAAAMRKMDGAILVGGHAGTGTPVSDPWNATVLKAAGQKMDFFAVHTYVVGGSSDDAKLPMQGCMAAVEQVAAKLADYRALVKEETGRSIPLAITEFNAGFVQEKPVPFRFSFGAALFCADYMRVMLQPETNVAFANYWQFNNGYWGYLRTKTENGETKVKTLAAYPVFKLLGQHAGDELLFCETSGDPKLEFEGFNKALPAKKDFRKEAKTLRSFDCPLADAKGNGYEVKATGKDSLKIIFKNFNGEAYANFKSFPVKAGLNYAIDFDLKASAGSGAVSPGLGLCDARGWEATRYACGVEGTSEDKEWTHRQTSMGTRYDAKGLYCVLRLLGGDSFSGEVEIKNIRISECEPESFPPYATLTALATGDAKNPKIVKLIVINKHHAKDISANIELKGIESAKLWTVSSPDLAATENSPNGAYERVSGEKVGGIGPDGFAMTFPARSINAIDIVLK